MSGTTVFVYGTLCWRDLLARVCGQDGVQGQRATLPGFATHWAAGHAFPMIAARDDAAAPGLLIRDCSDDVVARLDHYESGFGYALAQQMVLVGDDQVAALVYMPPADLKPGAPWDLDAWQSAHGPLAFEAAAEVMARFGLETPADIARKYPMMQVRASQRLNARAGPSPASPSKLTAQDITVSDNRLPYANFFAMQEIDIHVPRFEGGAYGPATRAGFLGTDASIVLPYDPLRDRVLLVEQFRVGPFLRADAHPWMMEPVAGRIDAGETAETTAIREGHEEAALTITKLHLVHKGYPSPGCSSEFFHVFVGITDLPDDAGIVGGLASEQEDIKGYLVDWAAFDDGLSAGQYPVLPLALAGHWLARNRDMLRGGG